MCTQKISNIKRILPNFAYKVVWAVGNSCCNQFKKNRVFYAYFGLWKLAVFCLKRIARRNVCTQKLSTDSLPNFAYNFVRFLGTWWRTLSFRKEIVFSCHYWTSKFCHISSGFTKIIFIRPKLLIDSSQDRHATFFLL